MTTIDQLIELADKHQADSAWRWADVVLRQTKEAKQQYWLRVAEKEVK